MAKKRSTVKRGARTARSARGNYNFSYKRRAALYRAAKISAQKRRNRRIKVAAGVVAGIAGVGAGAYLGHRYGPQAVQGVKSFKPQMALARNKLASVRVVNPIQMERVRIENAISPAPRRKSIPKPPRNVTHLDPESPDVVRARDTPYRPPGSHQKIDENTLEIIDRTDKYLPKELVKGRKLKQATVNKALAKDSKARAAATGQGRTTAEENAIVNSMIADGTVRSRATGGRKVKRKRNPKATQRSNATHGGLTESQWESALGFDVPQSSTTSGTNVAKNTTRSSSPRTSTAVTGNRTRDMVGVKLKGYDPKSESGKKMRETAKGLGLDITSTGKLIMPKPDMSGHLSVTEGDMIDFKKYLKADHGLDAMF